MASMTWKEKLGGVVVVAVLLSWTVGRVLHALGARHSGSHMLAEVVVFAVAGGLVLAARGRS